MGRKDRLKHKDKPRDEWIPESWRYNGSGYKRSKKKELPRKRKYRGYIDE